MMAKCYLENRCCLLCKLIEYEIIEEPPVCIEVFDDEKLDTIKEEENYVVQKEGFFYMKSSLAGSTYTLLGKSSDSLSTTLDSQNNNRRKEIVTNVDISIGYSEETSSIWLRIRDIQVTKGGKNINKGLNFKLKSKVSDDKNTENDYVCRVYSKFMTGDDILNHLFYFKNAKKEVLNEQTLKFTLFGKDISGTHLMGRFSKNQKLGELLIDLKGLDTNGNALNITHKLLNSSNSVLF